MVLAGGPFWGSVACERREFTVGGRPNTPGGWADSLGPQWTVACGLESEYQEVQQA